MKNLVTNYLPVVLWMVLIYVFSDQPNSNETTLELFGSFNYYVRKAAHMSEYAILFLLCYRAVSASFPDRKKNMFVTGLAFVITVLYACSDEWHQSLVPGRSALFSDVLIDTSGAFLVVTIMQIRSWLKGKTEAVEVEN